MASSSGNSSLLSSPIHQQHSGSDERKRKRMQSNRESARRSRVRKQKHLDDLMAKVNQLRRENSQILTAITLTTQHFLKVEADNSILHAQMTELTHQLHSLNDILTYMNNTGTNTAASAVLQGDDFVTTTASAANALLNVDPWNMMYFNQPIMVSQDLFQH
ncbi:bZIP transcription factor 11-like [Impatiens glandulifera]|uniref:bZIP transcription factor 11-like n=1 Tax=Impatiens glandulifera TaxID=253017 RepID=UPI001FB09851|nr:bZIP transcription factor 11-like [Impatiens glandulifera]